MGGAASAASGWIAVSGGFPSAEVTTRILLSLASSKATRLSSFSRAWRWVASSLLSSSNSSSIAEGLFTAGASGDFVDSSAYGVSGEDRALPGMMLKGKMTTRELISLVIIQRLLMISPFVSRSVSMHLNQGKIRLRKASAARKYTVL